MTAIRRRILVTLFAVLFVVMVGFSILFPVEPFYILTFGATSKTMGWLLAVFSLAQFILSPIWGRISDRVGRKPVMMIGLAGYAASMAAFGLAGSIPALFVTRALSGVFSAAALPTAMAVVADTTVAGERARGMGILGAAFGLGVIFGPFIGGMLAQVHMTLPFFATAAMGLLALVLVAVLLPESLHLRPPDTAPQHPIQGRWAALNADTIGLYAVALVASISLAGLETAFPFLADQRLGLTPRSVGYVYAVMGVVATGVQGGLVGPLQRRLGEERMILAGLLVAAAGLALVALAQTPVPAAAGISVFAAGHGLIRPANASLVSQRARVGHGLAIGLLDAMMALGRVLGPILGGQLYALQPAAPFYAGTLLNLLAVGGFFRVMNARGRGRGATAAVKP